jgi:hypothetical protein
MGNRKKYTTPTVMNLSGFGVLGSGFLGGNSTLGMCMPGSSPSSSYCTNGHTTSQAETECSPVGLAPQYGECASGTNASQGCMAGSFR